MWVDLDKREAYSRKLEHIRNIPVRVSIGIFTAVGNVLDHLGPICDQGQSSHTTPRSQGLEVSLRKLLSRHLRHG